MGAAWEGTAAWEEPDLHHLECLLELPYFLLGGGHFVLAFLDTQAQGLHMLACSVALALLVHTSMCDKQSDQPYCLMYKHTHGAC